VCGILSFGAIAPNRRVRVQVPVRVRVFTQDVLPAVAFACVGWCQVFGRERRTTPEHPHTQLHSHPTAVNTFEKTLAPARPKKTRENSRGGAVCKIAATGNALRALATNKASDRDDHEFVICLRLLNLGDRDLLLLGHIATVAQRVHRDGV
jgi:hypothetical protein